MMRFHGASLYGFAAIILSLAWMSSTSDVLANDIQDLPGSCSALSHTAEGPIGSDLTKRHSRFYCDSAVIAVFNNENHHLMIQFSQKEANHGTPIGFAGAMEAGGQILDVARFYLEPGKPIKADDGACKFFFVGKRMGSIFCIAKIDEGKRRTVASIVFNVAPGH